MTDTPAGTSTSPSDVSGLRALTLYLCFFASGAAGLVYEVLWAKYLALYVGSTGLAQVIVLATFMGGMALGSHLLGRLADRAASPLRFYVFLEFGIGLYALFFDRVFVAGRAVFIQLARAGNLTTGGLVAAQVAACVLSILLPTFLMGGTLPALGRFMIRSTGVAGRMIARLYFLNSLGAVCGCLLAGFYLIRTFGLQFSMVAGGALNVVVGAAAFLVLARAPAAAPPAAEPQDAAGATRMPGRVFAVILAAVSLSGAVSMMYEVAWIRLLTLVLGSSTYSFSLMLATFILGLSVGSLLLSLKRRPSGYTVVFGAAEVAVGLSVLLSLPFYVRLPYWFNQLASSLAREPATFGLYQACTFVMCAAVMFVPTVLQGITLPAATKILMRDVRTLGRRVGYIFAINTLGTLLGSVFAGFIGLPALGIRGTLHLAVALNVLLGLAVLATVRDPVRRRRALAVAVVAVAAVGLWYAVGMGAWDRQVLGAGVYRSRQRIPSYARLLEEVATRRTVFYRDGVDATISVQDVIEPPHERVLVINGKVDASTHGDLPTQKLIGQLPLLLHPNPESVLIVGIGSGATIGSVLTHDVKRVDVVELSRDVIEASRLFESVNGRFWDDPRVHVYWQDAKTFLQLTDRKYDVIVSEPTNPWIAGVAGVFSEEYFAHCRDRLAPGGLFVQWIQVYELEDATFFLMHETFTRVFPFYTMWNPKRTDTVFVASAGPLAPDFDRMEGRIAREGVRRDLEMFEGGNLLTLLAMQMADRARQPSHVAWLGAAHSDFFPVLEYIAPRGFFVGSSADSAKWMDERGRSPANARLWVTDYLARRTPAPEEFRACVRYLAGAPSLFDGNTLAWAREWLRHYPGDAGAALAVGTALGATHTDAASVLERPAQGAGAPGLVAGKVRCRMLMDDYRGKRSHLGLEGADALHAALQGLMDAHPETPDADLYRWRGEIEYDLGRYGDAVASLAEAARLMRGPAGTAKELPDTAVLLCRALLALGEPGRARGAWEDLLAPYGNDLEARLVRALIAQAEAAAAREGGVSR